MRKEQQDSRRSEGGAVTAETAVVLPALVLLLAALFAAAAVGITQLRLEEAARAGAREVVRGEPGTSVEDTIQRLAGPGADVSVAGGEGWTTVMVSTEVHGPLLDLFGLRLTATASGRDEQGG